MCLLLFLCCCCWASCTRCCCWSSCSVACCTAACCWSCCCCTCCCCGCSSSLTAVVLTLAPVASALAALAPFLADPRSKLAPALLTEAHSFLKAIARVDEARWVLVEVEVVDGLCGGTKRRVGPNVTPPVTCPAREQQLVLLHLAVSTGSLSFLGWHGGVHQVRQTASVASNALVMPAGFHGSIWDLVKQLGSPLCEPAWISIV